MTHGVIHKLDKHDHICQVRITLDYIFFRIKKNVFGASSFYGEILLFCFKMFSFGGYLQEEKIPV